MKIYFEGVVIKRVYGITELNPNTCDTYKACTTDAERKKYLDALVEDLVRAEEERDVVLVSLHNVAYHIVAEEGGEHT